MHIVVFGSGRSAGSLILGLLDYCRKAQHSLRVCDVKCPDWLQTLALDFKSLELSNEQARQGEVEKADIVLSLMPPALHLLLIQDCILFKKHFINASYLSPEIEALRSDIESTGKLFLVECGLDPGIDHMSAMKKTDELRAEGYQIKSFLSFTGGLVAPESDTNPWHYKISWNPRNVVLAGQGTARFRQDGSDRLVPYQHVFKRLFSFDIEGLGKMDGYANRDSLSYTPLYGMENAETFIRGTLRYPDYCQSWNLLVQLGLTDDAIEIPAGIKTWDQLLESYLPPSKGSLSERLASYLQTDPTSIEFKNLTWLGVMDSLPISSSSITPAQALQALIEEKWKLNPSDLDMIVMQHEWLVTKGKEEKKVVSSLVLKGKPGIETAMAQTVGLPMAIAAMLLVEGKLTSTGLHRPITKEFYEPILGALKQLGIEFKEKNTSIFF
jgi:saccharopine dehydrogenase-like NADP-dependent oxidoreductase